MPKSSSPCWFVGRSMTWLGLDGRWFSSQFVCVILLMAMDMRANGRCGVVSIATTQCRMTCLSPCSSVSVIRVWKWRCALMEMMSVDASWELRSTLSPQSPVLITWICSAKVRNRCRQRAARSRGRGQHSGRPAPLLALTAPAFSSPNLFPSICVMCL